jgi:hypothetical protein
MIIQDDAIAAVAHLTGAGEQIEAERSKLEHLLDCAGLALGAALQGTEMPPEVTEVTLHLKESAGFRSLVQQLEAAYEAYSAAAVNVGSSLPKPTQLDHFSSDLNLPERVVKHTDKDGLVDQIARKLPPSSACMKLEPVTLYPHHPVKSKQLLLS